MNQAAGFSGGEAIFHALQGTRHYEDRKSFQVVDTLSLIAQKDALRDDDWAHIEALALSLQTARRAEAGEA